MKKIKQKTKNKKCNPPLRKVDCPDGRRLYVFAPCGNPLPSVTKTLTAYYCSIIILKSQ